MGNPLLAVFIVTHIGFVKGYQDLFLNVRFLVRSRIHTLGIRAGCFYDAIALASADQYFDIIIFRAFDFPAVIQFKRRLQRVPLRP